MSKHAVTHRENNEAKFMCHYKIAKISTREHVCNPKILHHGPHCAGLSCPPLISIAGTLLEELYDDEKMADLLIIKQCFFSEFHPPETHK